MIGAVVVPVLLLGIGGFVAFMIHKNVPPELKHGELSPPALNVSA
jgi:hypothetical protein